MSKVSKNQRSALVKPRPPGKKRKKDPAPTIWPEVEVRHPAEAAEAVAHFLFEHGATAVLEEESGAGLVSRAGFGPGRDLADLKERLDAFLSRLALLLELPFCPEASWRLTPAGDWAESWKRGLAPIEIGRRLVVRPSWCAYEAAPGQAVLTLDPGLAFGTGHHETTRLCLEAIEAFFEDPARAAARVLDVGAGSGLLSLAAAALGQGPVLAVDNDPEVLPVAAENLCLNHLEHRVLLAAAGPEAVKGVFDLVLANLHQGALLRLAPVLARLTAPGGRLVLSGLLLDQVDEVARACVAAGLIELSRVERGEWAALELTPSLRA
jgi:ribosomal protein L11 methyltransferase